ncbi:MAG: histidine triad family protein [Thermoproteota archaeon]|nr:histidine triad family protein [Thermoproteota archaeon]
MSEEECIFCRIIRGELPSWKIIENDTAIGILDTNPSSEGHCLIIPKRHVRYWHDLSDSEVASLFKTAKVVAQKIKEKYKSNFICVFIRGGSVKHTHVVLFPSNEGDKLSGFPQSVIGKTDIDFAEVRDKLEIRDNS